MHTHTHSGKFDVGPSERALEEIPCVVAMSSSMSRTRRRSRILASVSKMLVFREGMHRQNAVLAASSLDSHILTCVCVYVCLCVLACSS